jgi:hypothetical protein
MKPLLVASVLTAALTAATVHPQVHLPGWQQEVAYTIDAQLFTTANVLTGTEIIRYTNRSPDTLSVLFLHVYANAFRKNSLMHQYQSEHSRSGSIISHLKEEFLGGQSVDAVRDAQGRELATWLDDTILRIDLAEPLPPGETQTVRFEFTLKIPWLIRRMGRHNREGIEYSMAQWYPKLCVYDRDGWHRNYYLGREFYGEFGAFDVSLTLPAEYVVGATGRLVNASSIGAMMTTDPQLTQGDRTIVEAASPFNLREDTTGRIGLQAMRTWRFRAEKVHDFAWCADPDYRWDSVSCDSVRINLLYQPSVEGRWAEMKGWAVRILRYLNENVGPYSYPEFTIAQAGDGGMEYPTIVFLTGERPRFSLASVTAHEMAHNWFYGMLANDETAEAWLDEGVTSYYTTRLMEHLFGRYANLQYDTAFKRRWYPLLDARVSTFAGYEWWAKQGFEEKSLTASDFFASDRSYGYATTYKGQIFMYALEYYFGRARLDSLMREFFRHRAHHHVSTDDFRRFLEKETGAPLKDMFHAWLNTTDACDYAVRGQSGRWVRENGRRYFDARIELDRVGRIAMPVDVFVKLENDSLLGFRIPAHPDDPDLPGLERRPVWNAVTTRYTLWLELDHAVSRVIIDTSHVLSDRLRMNNRTGILPPVEWHLQMPLRRYPTLDTYVMEHRPSAWYNGPDALRAGYVLRGRWATDEHRLAAGVFYGTSGGTVDYRLEYSTPLYSAGRQTTLQLTSYRMEGRSEQAVRLQKRYYTRTFDEAPVHDFRMGLRNSVRYDAAYLPRGVEWDGGKVNVLQVGWEVQTRRRDSPVIGSDIETSVFGSDWAFSRFVLTAKWPWVIDRRFAALELRSIAGYAVGQVPVQEQFYLAGASPRQMFDDRFYRSVGTLPASWWLNNSGDRHLYLNGEGSLSGYADAYPHGRRIVALNVNLMLQNPVGLVVDRVPRLLRLNPFLFWDGGVLWNREADLRKPVWDIVLMDGGLGLTYELAYIPVWMGSYAVRWEFPIWVSRPSINGERRAFALRWVFGLDRSL